MVKISYASRSKCCGCNKVLLNIRNVSRVGYKTIDKTREAFKHNIIQLNDYICNRCRKTIQKQHVQLKQLNDKLLSSDETHSDNDSDDSYKDDESDDSYKDDESDDSNFESTSNNAVPENLKKLKEKIELQAAFASHKYCFICKKNRKLHQINRESIILAYEKFGIVIKENSRCCSEHLDNNGQIKIDVFLAIPTKCFDKDIIKFVDLCLANNEKIQNELTDSSGIFDKFKDMSSLDEILCLKITGWTKLQFDQFSKYITNVRDTVGRTKEQLIAIYRFWLAKGIDQCSITMFKSNTSQQQISHYLAQIRTAISIEFVPLFLGANKGMDFFLTHNTESVKVLHNFSDDILAVIADGTYTRIEKSASNDFQYLSYSMQKTCNLVKPFLMCCADGYFIDCFGPFQANMNDAQILRHILKTDEDLKKLFEQKDKIAFFLDRGTVLSFYCIVY